MKILAVHLNIQFLTLIVILQLHGYEAQHYLGIRGQNFEGKSMSLRSHKSLGACGSEQFVGFYADTENGCQSYRMCYGGRQNTFLCPPGTLFSQILMTCDFWHKVNCNNGQRRKFTEITPPSTSSTPTYYNHPEEPEWMYAWQKTKPKTDIEKLSERSKSRSSERESTEQIEKAKHFTVRQKSRKEDAPNPWLFPGGLLEMLSN